MELWGMPEMEISLKAKNDDIIENKEEVYSESGREQLLEDDILSPEEEGFMQGYEDAS